MGRAWALEPGAPGFGLESCHTHNCVVLEERLELAEPPCPICLSKGKDSHTQCEGRAVTAGPRLHLVPAVQPGLGNYSEGRNGYSQCT